jgi:hypothetical protein
LIGESADFRDDISADEVERAVSVMDSEIKRQFPHVKRIFMEAEKRSLSNG